MSAFSVLPALAQLSIASVGESHDEILKAIGMPNDNVTKEVFSGVSRQLRSVKGVDLKLATRVYVRKDGELNEEFAGVSREVFNSDVKNIDFAKSSEAASEINTWVEDNTNHRIKDLISPQSLNANTAAVLVNAIYFKGKWKKPFDIGNTRDIDFHVSKSKKIQIPQMSNTDDFRYGESQELGAKLLEMAYEGDQSSLLIVLPNEIDGINSLIEKLKEPTVLLKAVENMYDTKVIVQLPKFQIETTTPLAKVLKEMGIQKLFTPGQARLNNLIKGSSDLYISEAIQKAFIVVNEEGAEAAAANEFSLDKPLPLLEYPGPQYSFRVNRPFYFEIRQNNLPLFDGIVIRPSF